MPSGTELATAYVQIVPSTEGIEGKISEALSGAADTAGSSSGIKAGGSFASAMAKGIAGGAAAVGAAAASITSAIVGNAVKVSEYGDHIDKMSQKIGISAESYQKWDYVMQRAGTSVDNLKAGMKTLTTAAASGSDAFEKLGISQEQLKSMNQEQLLEATIKGLAGMEEGAERASLATELLGKAGMDMGPLLNSGTEAIEEQMKMAEDYGMVMSDEAVAASAVFQDSLTTFKGTISGMKNSVFAEFLPSMSSVLDGLAMVFAGNEDGMELVSEGIEKFISKIGEILPHVLEIGGEILQTLAGAIMEHLPDLVDSATGILTQLVTTIVEHLPEIISAAVQIVGSLVSGLMQALPQIIQAAWNLMTSLGGGISEKIPEVVNKLPELITKMVNKLKEAVSEFVSIGGDIMAGLARGIANGISNVVKGIGDALGSVVSAAKSKLGIASPSKMFRDELGKNIMLGMAEGITENAKAVKDALNDVSGLATAHIQHELAFSGSDLKSGGSYNAMSDLAYILNNSKDNINVNVVLQGDASKIFKVVRKENTKFRTSTGNSAFSY